MATTPFTLVGNSADSRGLAQCRATVCCTLPNDHAQQPGPLGELHIPESEHAAPVGCSVLILIEAPSSAYRRGMLALGKEPQPKEEETSGDATPNSTNAPVALTCRPGPCTSAS